MPQTQTVASQLVHLAQVDSTNTYAEQLIYQLFYSCNSPQASDTIHAINSEYVYVVVADQQTQGRGRNQHSWFSQDRSSSTITYAIPVEHSLITNQEYSGWLQILAGLSTIQAINTVVSNFGHLANPLMLKWPNDIFCGGEKLGGILLQIVFDPNQQQDMLLIGIGLNLYLENFPNNFAPTSLHKQVENLPDFEELRDSITATTVTILRQRIQDFQTNPQQTCADLRKEVTSLWWQKEKPVSVTFNNGNQLTGTAIDIAQDASLLVQDESMRIHTVRTADVGVLGH